MGQQTFHVVLAIETISKSPKRIRTQVTNIYFRKVKYTLRNSLKTLAFTTCITLLKSKLISQCKLCKWINMNLLNIMIIFRMRTCNIKWVRHCIRILSSLSCESCWCQTYATTTCCTSGNLFSVSHGLNCHCSTLLPEHRISYLQWFKLDKEFQLIIMYDIKQ